MGTKPPLERIFWKKTRKFLSAALIPKHFILGLCLALVLFNLSLSVSAATIDFSDEQVYTDTISTIALSDYPDYFDTITVHWENDIFANTGLEFQLRRCQSDPGIRRTGEASGVWGHYNVLYVLAMDGLFDRGIEIWYDQFLKGSD